MTAPDQVAGSEHHHKRDAPADEKRGGVRPGSVGGEQRDEDHEGAGGDAGEEAERQDRQKEAHTTTPIIEVPSWSYRPPVR